MLLTVGSNFIVIKPDPGLRTRLEKCIYYLSCLITDTFLSYLSISLKRLSNDICLGDVSNQRYLLSYLTDLNSQRRHVLFKNLKYIVRLALDLEDKLRGETIDKPHRSENDFKSELSFLERTVEPGMFTGPNNTILCSWVMIESDHTLEDRLIIAMRRQLDEAKVGTQWLSWMLKEINRVFMTACFGCSPDPIEGNLVLLPYITLAKPFLLPFSGIINEVPDGKDIIHEWNDFEVINSHNRFIRGGADDYLSYLSEMVDLK